MNSLTQQSTKPLLASYYEAFYTLVKNDKIHQDISSGFLHRFTLDDFRLAENNMHAAQATCNDIRKKAEALNKNKDWQAGFFLELERVEELAKADVRNGRKMRGRDVYAER